MSAITLLGTGTLLPSDSRMAPSNFIELDSTGIVYDFGRGASIRLAQAGVNPDGFETLILSHFHPDHWSDLIQYFQTATKNPLTKRSTDLHIYGPAGTEELIDKILHLIDTKELTDPSFRFIAHDVEPGILTIGGHEINLTSLFHANSTTVKNFALRFSYKGKVYALCGDAGMDEKTATFIKDADIAVIAARHRTDDEIVELALNAQVKTLVCSHLYRELDEELLNRAADSNGFKGKIVVGKDLMSFEL